MNINLTHNGLLDDRIFWETKQEDKLPNGVEKIVITQKGDLLLQGTTQTWLSSNHFSDTHPVVVPQQFKGSRNHVDGWTGKELGIVGENRVRDIIVKTGKADPENILLPLQVPTKAGHKELSDGIILAGNHAFILQVKTSMPTHNLNDVDWYRQKIRTNRAAAIRQGLDSLQMLKEHKKVEFTTYAGTTRTVNVDDYSWSQVVILSIDPLPVSKPARYYFRKTSRIPTTMISLKEWHDLFTILDYENAIAFLKHRVYCETPDYFGFNLFNIFELVNNGVLALKQQNPETPGFVHVLDNLLNTQKPSKKLFNLRAKLSSLPVEQLTVLSDAYKRYGLRNTTKTIGVHKNLKVEFGSQQPGITTRNRIIIVKV